jgi:tetratricopeptide (TPR) repeat protein
MHGPPTPRIGGEVVNIGALSPDHPDYFLVAQSLNNLAAVYDHQGHYAEAESLCKSALGIFEKALGPDNFEVANLLNNLAAVYDHQGRYAEAEPLYKRSLAMREKAIGLDNVSVAQLLNNLAVLYGDLHRHLWTQVCHHELRHVVHGERDGCATGSAGQRADDLDRQLDGSSRDRRDSQHYRRGHGAGRAAAVAATSDGLKIASKEDGPRR